MASPRGLSLLRLRPTTTTSRSIAVTTSARPSLLPPPTRPLPLPSLRRLFSHSLPRARQQQQQQDSDPHQQDRPPNYDYDPLLGDPWYYYRLRQAKPLFGGRGLGEIIRRFLRSPRTRAVIVASGAFGALFYWWHLEVVPVSGRRRFNCFAEDLSADQAGAHHRRVMERMERDGCRYLPPDDPRVRMARRVLARLVAVAEAGAPAAGAAAWEVRVIDDDDPRHFAAFVIPGGKVFVHSSVMRVAQTEDQLAAILSHEIAHGLARHNGERMSQTVGGIYCLGSALLLFARSPSTFVAGGILGGILLAFLISRPMGRIQESEADYVGLLMMAEACYDPRQAVAIQENVERLHQQLGVSVSEFLSTHPSNKRRLESITGWLPEAMEKREKSNCRDTQGFAELFRRAMFRGDVQVRI